MARQENLRFRFGLKSLLGLVTLSAVVMAICAVIPERELYRGLRRGDSMRDVNRILGKPAAITSNGKGDEVWIYGDGTVRFEDHKLREVRLWTTHTSSLD